MGSVSILHRNHQPQPQGTEEALAQARAAAIKDYLVDRGGLAGERVFLLDAGQGPGQADGRVATPLHLDSE